MSAESSLQRAHVYLEDAQDVTLDAALRLEALDAARGTLIEARRARVSTQNLLPIFETICTTGASSPSHLARSVVPHTVEDLCLRDLRSFALPCTPYLERALHDDHVSVATRAVRTLTTLFRKLIGLAVSIRVTEPSAVDAILPDATLAVWLKMESKAVSLIQAPDEGLRKAATKFAETVILAFSYSGGPGSPDHFTLDYITANNPTSPLLDSTSLEQIGSRCVAALSSLVSSCLSGSVQTSRPNQPPVSGIPPFTFMTVISVLGNLVRRRRNILEATLPPLLSIVTAVTATPTIPSFAVLSEGQRQSILTVLRFTLQALRAYAHARSGRAGTDIARATNDLQLYERQAEQQRKERAQQHEQRIIEPPPPPIPLKHPRPPDRLFPRLPPQEAFSLAKSLAQRMPPQELVAFIITRLLLNIPPDESVPGVDISRRRERERTDVAALEEPAQKKLRKSRFAVKEPDRLPQSAPVKKVVAVRKVAPPVVAATLSDIATVKLVAICCRRILKKETEAISSGAGPLRIQLLARLLTRLARMEGKIATEFCEEACAFIAEGIQSNLPLAQAWLHCLVCVQELEDMESADKKKDKKESITETKNEAKPENMLENDSDSNDVEMQDSLDTSLKPGSMEETETGLSIGESAAVSEEPESSSETQVEGDIESDVELDDGDQVPLHLDPAYERIFVKLLDLVKEKYGSTGDAFTRLVTDAPVLPLSLIDILDKCCRDPSRIKLGLNTLRDVILERCGSDRERCLSLLLEYTNNEDEVLRGPAIRLVANNLFVECLGQVTQTIEEYATNTLKSAVDNIANSSSPEDVNRLDRASLLLTALCGQKHDLLRIIASTYSQAPSNAQKIILSRAKDLAAHIGMSALPILQLINGTLLSSSDSKQEPSLDDNKSGSDDGLEDLALEVLRAALKKFGKPTEDIVKAARIRYEINENTDFVIAVLPGLQREAIIQYLAAIVQSSNEDVPKEETEKSETDAGRDESNVQKKTNTFKDIVGTLMGIHPPALSPAELLIELHNIDPTPAASLAIRACFELKSVYKQESVAQAIQQLLEKTVTPELFMRTVHLARIFHPELETYLTETVMMKLIDKQVWKNGILWKGYLLYCSEVKERSVKSLLSLPVAQLEDALNRQQGLKTVFADLVSNPKNAKRIPVKHRKAIAAVIKRKD